RGGRAGERRCSLRRGGKRPRPGAAKRTATDLRARIRGRGRHRGRRGIRGEPALGGIVELTVLVFLPAMAAALILLLPRRAEQYAKWVALGASLLTLAISIYLFFDFNNGQKGF